MYVFTPTDFTTAEEKPRLLKRCCDYHTLSKKLHLFKGRNKIYPTIGTIILQMFGFANTYLSIIPQILFTCYLIRPMMAVSVLTHTIFSLFLNQYRGKLLMHISISLGI